MQAIYINWHGPFLYENIATGKFCDDEFHEYLSGYGHYAITGMTPRQRIARMQYLGITEQLYKQRFSDKSHKIHLVTRKRELWLGKIVYPKKVARKTLEDAEYMLIYFNDEAVLCERKTQNAPKVDCAVISHFFKKGSFEQRHNLPAIVRMIPEVMTWDTELRALRYCSRMKNLQL